MFTAFLQCIMNLLHPVAELQEFKPPASVTAAWKGPLLTSDWFDLENVGLLRDHLRCGFSSGITRVQLIPLSLLAQGT